MLYDDGYVSLDIDKRTQEIVRFNPTWRYHTSLYNSNGRALLTGKFELKIV